MSAGDEETRRGVYPNTWRALLDELDAKDLLLGEVEAVLKQIEYHVQTTASVAAHSEEHVAASWVDARASITLGLVRAALALFSQGDVK